METHQLSAVPSVLWSSQPMFHPLGALQSFFPGLFLQCKTGQSEPRSFVQGRGRGEGRGARGGGGKPRGKITCEDVSLLLLKRNGQYLFSKNPRDNTTC